MEKLFKRITVFTIIFFVFSLVFLLLFKNGGDNRKGNVFSKQDEGNSFLDSLSYENDENAASIDLILPEGDDENDVLIESDPYNDIITLSIKNGDSGYFAGYPLSGRADHIKDIRYFPGDETGEIKIYLDEFFECKKSFSNGTIHLYLLKPDEIFDHVLVIDPGHGGSDGGTIEGFFKEKDINLSIALFLKESFSQDENIKVYLTREDDSFVSVYNRALFAKKVNAGLLLSIHNNSLNGDENKYVNGTQVLYNTKDESGYSKRFSKNILESALSSLGTKDLGMISGDSIYIIRTAEMPVALVELGFMTNEEELKNLLDEEYQKRAADAMHDAVIKTFSEGETK